MSPTTFSLLSIPSNLASFPRARSPDLAGQGKATTAKAPRKVAVNRLDKSDRWPLPKYLMSSGAMATMKAAGPVLSLELSFDALRYADQ